MNYLMSKPDHATSQLSALTKKRLALESLIRITVSIQTQQESLQELSAIARPSQDFPAKLLIHIKQLSKRIGDLPVPELIQRVEVVEQVMAKNLDKLLLLAKVDIGKLRDEQLVNLSLDDFVDSISNFRRRTQTAVALRYLLKDRGVAIAPFSLAVPQESIFDHIEALKEKEKGCVKQIRKEMVSVVKDSDTMIQSKSLSEEMKQEILKVRQAMVVNLEHLNSGGSVANIPNVFETIVLESPSAESVIIEEPANPSNNIPDTNKASVKRNKLEQPKSKDKPKENDKAKTQNKPESFWGLAKLWLSSPWNKSWRSIKKDSKNGK